MPCEHHSDNVPACMNTGRGADCVPGEESCSKMQQGPIPNPKDVADDFYVENKLPETP